MPQSMTTARDIPILITSTATSSSERRITPSWTIAHLKIKLEPVTGIAPSSQILTLRLPDRQQDTPIQAEDEETVEIGTWPLVPYAEIKVTVSISDSFFLSFFVFFCLFVTARIPKPMTFQRLYLAKKDADWVVLPPLPCIYILQLFDFPPFQHDVFGIHVTFSSNRAVWSKQHHPSRSAFHVSDIRHFFSPLLGSIHPYLNPSLSLSTDQTNNQSIKQTTKLTPPQRSHPPPQPPSPPSPPSPNTPCPNPPTPPSQTPSSPTSAPTNSAASTPPCRKPRSAKPRRCGRRSRRGVRN